MIDQPWGREFAGIMTRVFTKAVSTMEVMQIGSLGNNVCAWKYALGVGIPGTWVSYDFPLGPKGLEDLLERFQAYQEQLLCHLHAHDVAADVPSQIPELFAVCMEDPSAKAWSEEALAESRSRAASARLDVPTEAADASPHYSALSPIKGTAGVPLERRSGTESEDQQRRETRRLMLARLEPIVVDMPFSDDPLDDYPTRRNFLAVEVQPTIDPGKEVPQNKPPPPAKVVAGAKQEKKQVGPPTATDKSVFGQVVGVRQADEDEHLPECHHWDEQLRLEDDEEVELGSTDVCPHVRAFVVAKVLRRPEQYSLPGSARRVVSHAVHIGALKKSVLEGAKPTSADDLEDNEVASPLYNIRTHNRFEVLAQLADEFEAVEEGEAARIITRGSKQARSQAPKPRAALETGEQVRNIRRQQEVETERISKAQPASQTPAQRAENGRRAANRIRSKIRELNARAEDLATYILMRPLVRYTRELIADEAPWVTSPSEALELGPLPWLACCVFNRIEAEETVLGLLKCYTVTARYVAAAPDSSWVRDLTGDGDVEANPGPISAPRSMEEVKAALPRVKWFQSATAVSWSDVESARVYLEEYNTCTTRNQVGTNDVLCLDYGWYPSGSGDRLEYRTAPFTTQYYPTQINEEVERHECPGIAELVEKSGERLPLCVSTGGHFPLADERDLYYYVEYSGADPGRVVATSKGGLFWAKHRKEVSRSPLDTPGVTSTRIFTRESVAAGTGTLGILQPFCAVLLPDNTITGWMVNGVLKRKEWYTPMEGAISCKLVGKAGVPGTGLRSVMVGYYSGIVGNGAEASLRHRTWGPPVMAVAAVERIGTALRLSDFFQAFLDAKDRLRESAIGSRPDVMESGYMKTYLSQVAHGSGAQPTTMAMAYLKIGLMHRWASFASDEPARNIVLAGQAQIHEPNTTFEKNTTVTRLLNASGMCREDCGGTGRPAFPFMQGHKQGRIVFYADPQEAVRRRESPLHVPWDIWCTGNMALVAAYVMLFTPWPCGNLSLLIKTHASPEDPARAQTYSWYGTTLSLPGELHISVVFPRDTTADLRAAAASRWSIPIVPTMGPTAVRHFAPFAPIPVVYRATDHIPKIRLVDFCVSWINGLAAGDLANLASILSKAGLCDGVDRWAVDGLTLYSNHSGLMAVGRVDPAAKEPEPIDEPDCLEDPAEDEVPLLMRCWRDVGDRMAHVPSTADWTNWVPEADWTLPLPDIRSVGLVVLGLYQFDMATKDTTVHVLLSSPYVGAALFVAGERRFIAWKQIHSEARVSYENYQRAVNPASATSGERRTYDNVFGLTVYQPGRYTALISKIMTAVHGAKALRVTAELEATRFLRRPTRWEPNTWDLTNATPLNKVVPGALPDSVMYTWSRSIPQEDMPFVITTKIEGASRALVDAIDSTHPPPRDYDGPFLEMRRYQNYLRLNDMADPTSSDIWENRLMHFVRGYFLGEFHTAEAARGAPPAGYAPIPLTRRPDGWQRIPGVDMTEISATYPNVCTTWTPWTDSVQHQVVALIAPHHGSFWMNLRRFGEGGRGAGIVYEDSAPYQAWYSELGEVGPGLHDIEVRCSGNGGEGVAEPKGRTDSQPASSNTPTPTPPSIPPPSVSHPTDGSSGLPALEETH
nr:MAG: hypothetical protein [Totiviridae sp.]